MIRLIRIALAGVAHWGSVLVTLAGAVALAGEAWFLAPLLVVGDSRPLEDPLPRLLPSAAILAVWAIATYRADRRRIISKRLAALPAKATDPNSRAARDAISLLQKRMVKALRRLRSMRFRQRFGGRSVEHFVYRKPWYLVIGAPGSGKTAALAAASFSLSGKGRAPAPPEASGATQHGEWWLTERAVLIDTAGRYTTQDSHPPVDSRVWAGLLEMVKACRPHQPINGVVITVSFAALITWTEAERRAHALSIRQRLQEIDQALGVRFPIYVIGAQADRIAGFHAFFDTLTPAERSQVWGMTFPLDDGPDGISPNERAGWFRDNFLALLRRLDERLLERLHQEPDLEQRSLCFAFPLKMAALEAPLADLLETAFSTGLDERPLLLRGVYFTAAMPGFFLKRLFRDVVFAEANLVGVDKALERARRRRGAARIGATLAAALALALFWKYSYAGNRELVSRVDAAVIQAAQILKALDTPPHALGRVDDTDFAAVLPALGALRAIPTGYADPWHWSSLELSGGLYQGNRLSRPASDAYRLALRSLFLSRIVLRLEEQLRANWAKPEPLRLCLRVYLMLSGREPLKAALVTEWVTADWRRTLPGVANEADRRALGEHLVALFAVGFAPIPADETLLERVGEILNQPTPSLETRPTL